MRSLVLVAGLLFAALAACKDAAPTPEYAKAKAAYQAAFAETADITYSGARWDEVLALLKAVPASNEREHKLARTLVDDIEATRARIAKDMIASKAVADKLLDIKSLPPLEVAEPHTPQPKEPTAAEKQQKCLHACTTSFMACMRNAGCETTSSTATEQGSSARFNCLGEAATKGMACKDAVNACGAKCK